MLTTFNSNIKAKPGVFYYVYYAVYRFSRHLQGRISFENNVVKPIRKQRFV